MGIGTKSEAIEMLNNDSPYVYKLNAAGIKEFVTECAEMSVTQVSQMINEIYKCEKIRMECPECSTMIAPDYMYSTGYKGDGGVGIVELDYVCGDCHCSGSCGHCGEYIGDFSEEMWSTYEKTLEELKDKFNFRDIKRIYKKRR